MMAAPLQIGSNILNMSAYDLETFKNTEVIAVDQDKLGQQGSVVWQSCGGGEGQSLQPQQQGQQRLRQQRLGRWSQSEAEAMRDAYAARKRRSAAAEATTAATTTGTTTTSVAPRRVGSTGSCTAIAPCEQIWARNLSDGSVALAFVNYTRPYPNLTHIRAQDSAEDIAYDASLRLRDASADGASAGASAGTAAIDANTDADADAALTDSGAHTGAEAGAGNNLILEPCDASMSKPEQLWDIKTKNMSYGRLWVVQSTIQAIAGNKACWEINGCGYRDGSSVDTSFGCKGLPDPGIDDKCCANMAWSVNKNGTISTVFDHKMCFEIRGSSAAAAGAGGGMLSTCVPGAKQQQWQLKGSPGKQQIESLVPGAGCIARPAQQRQAPQQPLQQQAPTGTTGRAIVGDSPQLVFDVSSLGAGWEKGAKVRDLWAHKDLGVMTKVSVGLGGAGDSRMFKLTKA
eukprot:g2127.t1